MKPSQRLRFLISQMPIEEFSDSEDDIQAFESSPEGTPIKIENVDNTLNNRDFELRQRLVTSTGMTNNHESTDQVAASIVTKKEDFQGNPIGDVIEEVDNEVFHEDFIQKGNAEDKTAKEPDCEDIVVKEATKQDTMGESFIEGDSVQVNHLLLDISMENDAEKNNIEKGDIAENAVGLRTGNSSSSAPIMNSRTLEFVTKSS